MGEPMNYINEQLRGVPAADSVLYRYQQIGYLKGILNYSSGQSIQRHIAEALETLGLEQIPSLEKSVEEKSTEVAQEVAVTYIESPDFVERVVPVVIDNLVTTFDLHPLP